MIMQKNTYPLIDKEATADTLKALMICRKLKPTDIQEYLGLSCVQTVYRWMEGINIPSIDHLYALRTLFGVEIDDILKGTCSQFKKNSCKDPYFYQQMRLALFFVKTHNK